jgi:hypothetical protein
MFTTVKRGNTMNREEMADKISQALMKSDLADILAEVMLEDALDTILRDLTRLSVKSTLSDFDAADYKNSLKNAKALLHSLRYFSTNFYLAQEDELKAYKKRYKELTKND